jgi:threonylcarbamoyladenosine tRNA methylthiotransferase MtaB
MRVYFTNLGCKLNQAEIERLGRQFAAAGHEIVEALEEADLHIVNSCTVTHSAARASRRAAGKARRVDHSRRMRTVLTGCHVSESSAEEVRLAGVDLVVPNAEKDLLLARVHEAFPDVVPGAGRPLPVPYVPLPFGHTRALVKVEDGCNMRCSFCIIPFTRGPQQSRPLPDVVAEVRALVGQGHREIVVTGVQISAYRWQGVRLAALVRELLAATDVRRLRLTSIAPWELDDELLGVWADRRLCRHLHLSLQSGATATLRRMRRPYTAVGYLDLLRKARAVIPGVAITSDVIVGFPGETAAEFAESRATVEAAGFAKLHVFPYSPRPGTEAARMAGQVPLQETRLRMDRFLEVARHAERSFQQAHLGSRQTVLWERPKGGIAHGLTDNYLRVVTDSPAALWNQMSEVELTELAEDGVWGKVVA